MTKPKGPDDRPVKADADYPVGYGRPPKEHQFKKGKSGNPKGRPKTHAITLPPMGIRGFLAEEVHHQNKTSAGDMTTGELAARRLRTILVNGSNNEALRAMAILMSSDVAGEELRRQKQAVEMEKKIYYKVIRSDYDLQMSLLKVLLKRFSDFDDYIEDPSDEIGSPQLNYPSNDNPGSTGDDGIIIVKDDDPTGPAEHGPDVI